MTMSPDHSERVAPSSHQGVALMEEVVHQLWRRKRVVSVLGDDPMPGRRDRCIAVVAKIDTAEIGRRLPRARMMILGRGGSRLLPTRMTRMKGQGPGEVV